MRCPSCGATLVRREGEYPSQFKRRQFCGRSCAGKMTGPHPETPFEDRFWAKVDQRSDAECWPWLGYVQENGYGKVMDGAKCRLAHRVMYELLVAPIPEGLVIDHVRARGCRRRDCVNPAHLEPVTMGENLLRGDSYPAARAGARAYAQRQRLLKATT